jgi:hypothetical protein
MRNVLTNNTLVDLWKEAKTPLDYVLTTWVTGLAVLAFTGIGVIVFELITNPLQFSNATFGIFDTLGN